MSVILCCDEQCWELIGSAIQWHLKIATFLPEVFLGCSLINKSHKFYQFYNVCSWICVKQQEPPTRPTCFKICQLQELQLWQPNCLLASIKAIFFLLMGRSISSGWCENWSCPEGSTPSWQRTSASEAAFCMGLHEAWVLWGGWQQTVLGCHKSQWAGRRADWGNLHGLPGEGHSLHWFPVQAKQALLTAHYYLTTL